MSIIKLTDNNRKAVNAMLLALLCIATFFINNTVINTDIMESRNIITAREMVYDGHWIVPTLNGELRLEKPPLPTWITAVAEMVVPDSLALQRGMAGMAAVLLVVFVYKFSDKVLKTDKWLATLLLCTCYNVILMGRTASWDIYCHAFMMGAIYFLARAMLEDGDRWKRYLLCGAFAGLSLMSKGPVSLYALFLPFLISFAVIYRPSAKGQAMRITSAAVLAVALGGWWYAYIYIMHPEAMAYVANKESGSWINHNVRAWYYYWKFFLETGVWSLLLLTAIITPALKRSMRKNKGYMFSLLWTLLTVVLLSLLPEKKTRYLLPMLIPASMAMACYLHHLAAAFKNRTADSADKWAFRANAGLIAMAVVILPVAAYMFIVSKGYMPMWVFICFTLFFISVAVSLIYDARKLRPKMMVVTVTILFVVAECFAMPYLDVVINNVDRHSIELTRHNKALQQLPFYHSDKEPMRIEMVYAAHKSIRPIDLGNSDSVMSHLPFVVITHKRIGETMPKSILERIDTVWVGLYDDNRRPKGTRRYSGEFIYNVTVLKKK